MLHTADLNNSYRAESALLIIDNASDRLVQ